MTPHAYGIHPPGFRLPDAAHPGAVRLLVSDLARSLEYYQRVLGFRVHAASPDTATLGPAGGNHPLLTLHVRSGVKSARRGAFGLYHLAVLLPDRAALGRFAAHVASLGLRVGSADHLVSEAFYLWDPDGLGIEVYADRPRSTWQHRGRELKMTTDPLDVDSLLAAGGAIPWDGAPPGTTIGHVHLHVGRLDTAEAFYHRALGFDKTVWTYPGALFFSAGGYHHHLGTNTWSPGPAPPPNHAQLLDWDLLVPADDDVADVERSLRESGYAVESAKGELTAADPWGTRVRVRTDYAAREPAAA